MVISLEFIYIVIPFLAWFIAGSLKFLINYIRFNGNAFEKIGNGGFPSTHTTVVTTTVVFIGLHAGFSTPVFSLAETFLVITIIDALGIRRALGKHAESINRLTDNCAKLRESQGHTLFEVLGGLGLGILLGYLMTRIVNFYS